LGLALSDSYVLEFDESANFEIIFEKFFLKFVFSSSAVRGYVLEKGKSANFVVGVYKKRKIY